MLYSLIVIIAHKQIYVAITEPPIRNLLQTLSDRSQHNLSTLAYRSN